ncbi:hypothetical protein MJO28_015230 [Puccinia striiformis f. sp. tritici]|uniref:Uncharacterized protein n=1 Tax=Puccinia striiformis f. sp. tritici TaxID=168172 RepID=A0ACC0DTZ7_9BASI|nr:hypothetical protein MJO28_015230 [Puccinia striiformis f. sp. tritici]
MAIRHVILRVRNATLIFGSAFLTACVQLPDPLGPTLALDHAPQPEEDVTMHLLDVEGRGKPGAYVAPKITPWIKITTWFTPYRQLFLLAFGINLIGAAFGLSRRWMWSLEHVMPIMMGNILLAIAIRSEWVLRFIYWIAVKSFRPRFFPLWVRLKVVGTLYHIDRRKDIYTFESQSQLTLIDFFLGFEGGVHSGCGLSAFLWQTVASYNYFREAHRHNIGFLVTLGICQACLFITCMSAFPIVRGRFHEMGIISTLLSVALGSFWDIDGQRWDTHASRILRKPELWFLVAIFVIYEGSCHGICSRFQKFYASAATLKLIHEKATVIRVPGGLTSGLHTRISFGGLREWHIFGSISEGKDAEYHYIVAAVQGEFTRSLNVEQPTELYTKRWKPCGLPYFSRLFTRGLAICTGSGIGAVASTCMQHDSWFLIWIGPDLGGTYGKEILQLIRDRIPATRRVIWDTRGPLGRPDVVKLIHSVHNHWKAEATLFIGSPAMNANVLRSCSTLKIPVFGSIWDA